MQIDPFLGTENDLINLINKADEQGIKIILDGVFNHTGDDSVYFNKYGNYDSYFRIDYYDYYRNGTLSERGKKETGGMVQEKQDGRRN